MENNHFFSPFSAVAVAKLISGAQNLHFAPEQLIFVEGSQADAVYLILKGKVRLGIEVAGHTPHVIKLIEAGDYFGEMGVLDGAGRSTGAWAEETSELARIPQELFLEVLRKEPFEVSLKVVTRVFEYLRNTNDRYISELLRKGKMEFLGEMAGTIIHDFKNPIMGVQLATELIRQEKDEAERQRWCDVIYDQTVRMVEMAQELLEFSRGGSTLVCEPIAMADLFRKFQILNEAYIGKSGVEVRVDTDDSMVQADGGKMLRVFQNLTVNAIEAFQGKPGTLEFKTRRRDGQVVIRIRDNGPGIPQNIRANFFEPFVTAGKKNGSGLGASIVKQIVEAHGGSIVFDTETGRGTTFYIRLSEFNA